MNLDLFGDLVRFINIVLFIGAIGIVFSALRRYHRTTIGITFIHYLSGLVLIGANSILFFLNGAGIFRIPDMTLMLLWHILYYVAILIFTIAAYAFVHLFTHSESHEQYLKTSYLLNVIAILTVALLFFFYPIINYIAVKYIDNSVIDRVGVLHFLAFIESGICAAFIYKIKSALGHPMDTVVRPNLIALSILGVVHLWELLTESWKVIHIHSDYIELIESTLWIFVYIFIIVALRRFRKLSEPVMQKANVLP